MACHQASPSITITAPQNGKTYNESDSITIIAQISDNVVIGVKGPLGEDVILLLGGIILCIGFLIALAMMIPMIAVSIRRLHDTNRSGWFYLLSVIPIINYIGSIVLLAFYSLDGDVGANQYGADPKGRVGDIDKDSVDALE